MQSIESVRQRINEACQNAGRNPSDVRLLAVAKRHPATAIRAAAVAGQLCFGENQINEALAKQSDLHDLNLEWHFIGTIQSNKTKDIARHFDWAQSVDREKILRRLSSQRPTELDPLNICLQVNIDMEPQKSGLLPDQVSNMATLAATLPGIHLRGIMAIPRASENAIESADSFRRVAEVYSRIKDSHPGMDTLSMGMSADLEIAIAQGSTMVRIGTDIFGPRPNQIQDSR